jgi:hypothetical protein
VDATGLAAEVVPYANRNHLRKKNGVAPPPARLRTIMLTKPAALALFNTSNADFEVLCNRANPSFSLYQSFLGCSAHLLSHKRKCYDVAKSMPVTAASDTAVL